MDERLMMWLAVVLVWTGVTMLVYLGLNKLFGEKVEDNGTD